MSFVVTVSIVYLFSILASPFPLWGSYLNLWRAVLRNRDGALGVTPRLSLAVILCRYFVLCPFFTLGWFVDELLHPGYRNFDPGEIIFILSQPRSGSTFFHRQLARDQENFVAVKHAEWRFPLIWFHKLLKFVGLEGWLLAKSYWPSNERGKLASKMHSHVLGNWEEDGIFFEERFLFHYFVFRRFPYPEILYATHDFENLSDKQKTKILTVHRQVIQKVLYMRGWPNGRVVLKENESMQIAPYLLKLYPHIKFVVLTRPTKEFVNSYVELSRASTNAKIGIDPMTIPEWHSANIWKRIEECKMQVKFFRSLPAQSQATLSYTLLLRDILGSFNYLYEQLGISMSKEFASFLEQLQKKQQTRVRGYEVGDYRCNELSFYDDFDSEITAKHLFALERNSQLLKESSQ